jgi:hypothetical protein
VRRVAAAVAAISLSAIPASAAEAREDLCLAATPPAASAPPHPLRFGVTPQLAGTVGGSQGEVAPEDADARDLALKRLRPPRRELVVRLNRLFMSDGEAAIALFAHRVRRYARRGYGVEAQVRYHPSAEQDGDVAAWKRFVRRATRSLAESPALVALSITNEVNLPISANTSDGAYHRATEAIVAGIATADRTLRRMDRADVDLGFTYAYRYLPSADAAFWTSLGQLATPRFRNALDYVGVQLYPGLFWPPVLGAETAGEATLEGLTLVRSCFMPQAGLGAKVDLWITELGYATNPDTAKGDRRPSSPRRSAACIPCRARSASPTCATSTCATTDRTGAICSTASACCAPTTHRSRRSAFTAR